MTDEYTIQPKLVVDPADTRTYDVDFFSKAANFWRANEDFGLTEYVRPTLANGFAYQASVAGTSAGAEPRWPKALGLTVVDGSVTWTCVAAGANGINAISSPTAASDPTGLTIAGVAVSETRKIRLTVSGGLLGQNYDVVFSFTLNGVARVARHKVECRKK